MILWFIIQPKISIYWASVFKRLKNYRQRVLVGLWHVAIGQQGQRLTCRSISNASAKQMHLIFFVGWACGGTSSFAWSTSQVHLNQPRRALSTSSAFSRASLCSDGKHSRSGAVLWAVFAVLAARALTSVSLASTLPRLHTIPHASRFSPGFKTPLSGSASFLKLPCLGNQSATSENSHRTSSPFRRHLHNRSSNSSLRPKYPPLLQLPLLLKSSHQMLRPRQPHRLWASRPASRPCCTTCCYAAVRTLTPCVNNSPLRIRARP